MCVYVASSLERKESGCDAVDVIWCMSIFASRCCLVVWVLYVCVCVEMHDCVVEDAGQTKTCCAWDVG